MSDESIILQNGDVLKEVKRRPPPPNRRPPSKTSSNISTTSKSRPPPPPRRTQSESKRPPPPPTRRPQSKVSNDIDQRMSLGNESRKKFLNWMSAEGPDLNQIESNFFKQSILYLLSNTSLKEEGLFRIPASKIDMLELAACSDKDLDLFHVTDPNTVAGFFKSCLRRHDNLFFNRKELRTVSELCQLEDDLDDDVKAKALQELRNLIQNLDHDKFVRLCWMILLFTKIVTTPENRMKDWALATATAPSVFPHVGISMSPKILIVLLRYPAKLFIPD